MQRGIALQGKGTGGLNDGVVKAADLRNRGQRDLLQRLPAGAIHGGPGSPDAAVPYTRAVNGSRAA